MRGGDAHLCGVRVLEASADFSCDVCHTTMADGGAIEHQAGVTVSIRIDLCRSCTPTSDRELVIMGVRLALETVAVGSERSFLLRPVRVEDQLVVMLYLEALLAELEG